MAAAPSPSPARTPAPHRLGRAAPWLVALALLAGLVGRGGSAAESGKTITIGESNSETERGELLAIFGYSRATDEVITISVEETRQAMAGIFPDANSINTAYSSTALGCRDLGDGITVTTINILGTQAVPPSMYALALVTAGIGDVDLIVAAPAAKVSIGKTALTGVFESYDRKPCASGNTSETRQRLALEEVSVAADIGTYLVNAGVPTGMQIATDLVLLTQQQIVIEALEGEDEISEALAAQEASFQFQVPADLRARLVGVLVDLVQEEIDWSTFARGWTIDFSQQGAATFRIDMKRDGIAIQRAQQTATAAAAAELTATAEAAAALTATADAAAALTAEAEAALTATAAAELTATADAQATQDAIAALTATAAAQPTTTPIPSPTATPEPFAVTGRVVAAADDVLTVEDDAGAEQVYAVADDALLVRDGKPAAFDDLSTGDSVRLTVDGMTRAVTRVEANAASIGLLARLAWLGWLLPVAMAAPPALWFARRRGQEPFIVREVAA
jgi:uncharacterized protein YpuA (DUF1002 family)